MAVPLRGAATLAAVPRRLTLAPRDPDGRGDVTPASFGGADSVPPFVGGAWRRRGGDTLMVGWTTGGGWSTLGLVIVGGGAERAGWLSESSDYLADMPRERRPVRLRRQRC